MDWEIFNKPNKNSINGFSHFAVKAEKNGRLVDARVLQGDLHPPYSGDGSRQFGFGFARESMAGLPHFKEVQFNGEYPIAELSFRDPSFPGLVRMKAFNPFIPLNDKDSSLPAAFFEIEVENLGESCIDYSVALTVKNPNGSEKCVNLLQKQGDITVLKLGSTEHASAKEPELGDISIATNAVNTSCQEYWFRGIWCDSLRVFWRDFTAKGFIKHRRYGIDEKIEDKSNGNDHGTIAAHFSVAPGTKGAVRFILAWNFPIFQKYWKPMRSVFPDGAYGTEASNTWKNYYATVFDDSFCTAVYGLKNWNRLSNDTILFKDSLFSSSLPPEVLDAISANISILKTPTSMRLEDGSFYGFEGCGPDFGCCEGSCTHVWNYAYAMPFLFPSLERSMRELDYKYNLRDDGGMPFRLQLPPGSEMWKFRPCVDGQFGGVIKVYREWKISGDTEWMRRLWPSVKKSIEFAWAETNEDLWDPEKKGVITGRQHHTLDMELFGPNSWLTGFYLAALKAGAEMAEVCGEPETANEYMEIFARGKNFVEKHLFNGEYYSQSVNINDRTVLEPFRDADDRYWNKEHGEIKYQIAEGCGIDQVVAQWHANLCGLGEIFDKSRAKKALASIYKHNFKRSFREFPNFCRLYALNDEAGTVMFSWPAGKQKPVVPITYAEETMHGFEYQVAAHMIMEGMVLEGCELVKAVRDRYDGEKRNPWNEIECGSNYARSMASFALLPALSGFEFDMTRGMIGFSPKLKGKDFRCFWSVDGAWGTVHVTKAGIKVDVLYGSLELQLLRSSQFSKCRKVKATVDGKVINASTSNGEVSFAPAITLRAVPEGLAGTLKTREEHRGNQLSVIV